MPKMLSHSYFNPRSREGSDDGFQICTFRTVSISIHAPARGATAFLFAMLYCFSISIHAPARGATTSSNHLGILIYHFNPRSREGSDLSALFQFLTCMCNFNPRSREGSDSTPCEANRVASVFQSTLPRGERLLFFLRCYIAFLFQSTLPRGERQCCLIRECII